MSASPNNDAHPAVDFDAKISVFTWFAWIFVALGFLSAAVGYYFFQKEVFTTTNLSAYGSYLQGAVGSLWTLAGLFFIYVAFLGQKQQLVKQDAELQAQEKQFALQHDSIKRQNFESSFFQILNLQQSIVAGMHDRSDCSTDGRDCFGKWYQKLKEEYQSAYLRHKVIAGYANPKKEINEAEFTNDAYGKFYNHKQAELGHYFRTLYHIFKFVKFSEMPDKRRYTSIARAQLSQYELTLLFYNSVSVYGKEKFKPLIEEFGLLENLDTDLLLDPGHTDLFYKESAFE